MTKHNSYDAMRNYDQHTSNHYYSVINNWTPNAYKLSESKLASFSRQLHPLVSLTTKSAVVDPSARSHAWISQLINSAFPFTTFMTLQPSEDVREKTKKAIESWWPSLELLIEILFSWKLNDTYRSYISRKSLEHQVVAGMVTRVRTVNSHNNSTIKIPVANRLRYPL